MSDADRASRVLQRVCLFAFLILLSANLVSTGRWAHVPSSLNGGRRPLFVATLLLMVAMAVAWRRIAAGPLPRGVGPTLWIGSLSGIVALFLVWFPISSWNQIPITNNWAARFTSTVDGIRLFEHGAVTGWQWEFLGGYPTSADFTVRISLLAWAPMAILGERVGFHATHLLLFLAIPLAVYIDFRGDRRELAPLAGTLAAIGSAGLSFYFMQSGDTNSLAAVAAIAVTLAASSRAAAGSRAGAMAVPVGLVLTAYSHAGFLLYAALLLVAESLYYRDRRRGFRTLVALSAAGVATLPLFWEPLRYRTYFVLNNAFYDSPSIGAVAWLRQIFYNIEILFLPWRWFNDYVGLTNAAWPVLAWTAWRVRGRPGFYAAGALLMFALLRLNTPLSGFALFREQHLLALLTAPALAGFALAAPAGPRLAVATIALVASYMAVRIEPVPQTVEVTTLAPELVGAVRASSGSLVLVENNFGLNMIALPNRRSEPRGWLTNYEALIPGATGRRLYAGLWDGWQNVPFKGRLLASGAWMGRALSDVESGEFRAELRRWGISDLFVWSATSTAYLHGLPDFVPGDRLGPWQQFRRGGGDSRSVLTAGGRGELIDWGLLGGTIALTDVPAGSPIVVRTSFHPAWQVMIDGVVVPTFESDGQLACRAPRSGTYRLEMSWPRRRWLSVIALSGLACGIAGIAWLGGPRERRE